MLAAQRTGGASPTAAGQAPARGATEHPPGHWARSQARGCPSAEVALGVAAVWYSAYRFSVWSHILAFRSFSRPLPAGIAAFAQPVLSYCFTPVPTSSQCSDQQKFMAHFVLPQTSTCSIFKSCDPCSSFCLSVCYPIRITQAIIDKEKPNKSPLKIPLHKAQEVCLRRYYLPRR